MFAIIIRLAKLYKLVCFGYYKMVVTAARTGSFVRSVLFLAWILKPMSRDPHRSRGDIINEHECAIPIHTSPRL